MSSKLNAALADALLDLINICEERGWVNISHLRFVVPPNSNIEFGFMSADAVAYFLEVSPETLANWRINGGGPRSTLFGGIVVYRWCDVLQFSCETMQSRTSKVGGRA